MPAVANTTATAGVTTNAADSSVLPAVTSAPIAAQRLFDQRVGVAQRFGGHDDPCADLPRLKGARVREVDLRDRHRQPFADESPGRTRANADQLRSERSAAGRAQYLQLAQDRERSRCGDQIERDGTADETRVSRVWHRGSQRIDNQVGVDPVLRACACRCGLGIAVGDRKGSQISDSRSSCMLNMWTPEMFG